MKLRRVKSAFLHIVLCVVALATTGCFTSGRHRMRGECCRVPGVECAVTSVADVLTSPVQAGIHGVNYFRDRNRRGPMSDSWRCYIATNGVRSAIVPEFDLGSEERGRRLLANLKNPALEFLPEDLMACVVCGPANGLEEGLLEDILCACLARREWTPEMTRIARRQALHYIEKIGYWDGKREKNLRRAYSSAFGCKFRKSHGHDGTRLKGLLDGGDEMAARLHWRPFDDGKIICADVTDLVTSLCGSGKVVRAFIASVKSGNLLGYEDVFGFEFSSPADLREVRSRLTGGIDPELYAISYGPGSSADARFVVAPVDVDCPGCAIVRQHVDSAHGIFRLFLCDCEMNHPPDCFGYLEEKK